jgi:2-keto-3-deoxy-L-rhamnonate aldolase RhmA
MFSFLAASETQILNPCERFRTMTGHMDLLTYFQPQEGNENVREREQPLLWTNPSTNHSTNRRHIVTSSQNEEEGEKTANKRYFLPLLSFLNSHQHSSIHHHLFTLFFVYAHIVNMGHKRSAFRSFSFDASSFLLLYLFSLHVVLPLPWAITPKPLPPYSNRLKERLQAGNISFCGYVTIPSGKVVENYAIPGYLDCVLIDAGHSEFEWAATQSLVMTAMNEDLVSLVRIPHNNYVNNVKKYVGTGVNGVVIPDLNNVTSYERAVSFLRYPPVGVRPAGVERSNGYLYRFEEYRNVANDVVIAAGMIETKESVAAIDEIVRVEGLDLLLFEKKTLAVAMGKGVDDPTVAQALQRIEQACTNANVPFGTWVSSFEEACSLASKGYQLFIIDGDYELLQNGVLSFFGEQIDDDVGVDTDTDADGSSSNATPANIHPDFNNPLRSKLNVSNNDAVFAAFVTIPSSKTIENLAAVSDALDAVWIEAEHTEFDSDVVQELASACENQGIVPLVRVPGNNNVNDFKKYIGTGVKGVIIPDLPDTESFEYGVSSLMYPTDGIRQAGCERANTYWRRFDEYLQVSNDLILHIFMIENKEAVANIDSIVAVPGIDVLHIGPFDLSLSMNVSRDSRELHAAVEKVEFAANQSKIALGCAVSSLSEAHDKMKKGYRFFTIPGDMEFIQKGTADFFEDGEKHPRNCTGLHQQPYFPEHHDPKPYTNPLKEKLSRKEPIFSAFVVIPSAKTIENLALPGYLDAVWIEAEHTEFGPSVVQELVVAAESTGLVALVRIPNNKNVNDFKKYLGTGAMGVIIPDMHSLSQFEYGIKALKYPPEGIRPAGVERSNRYLGRFAEYKAVANDLVMVIMMIENPSAVDNIEEIVQLLGIDILHVGPFDLSLSMNVSRNSKELNDAVAKVENAAKNAGVALGCALTSMDDLEEKLDRGYIFFTVPGDMEFLRNGVTSYFTPSTSPQPSTCKDCDDRDEEIQVLKIALGVVSLVAFVAIVVIAVLYRSSKNSKQVSEYEMVRD